MYLNTSRRAVGPVRRPATTHPTRAHAVRAPHGPAPHDGEAGQTKGATAVIEHGANPGLVTHFAKQAPRRHRREADRRQKATGAAAKKIAQLERGRLVQRARACTGVKVIHISERDTQITEQAQGSRRVRQHLERRGLLRGGHRAGRARLGHAREAAPASTPTRHERGPAATRSASRSMGMNTWVRSWVPELARSAAWSSATARRSPSPSTSRSGKNGKAVYRPTVHYAYCPCDAAIASLHEMRGCNYRAAAENQRIMNDEITSGADELGVLLMGHPYKSWWVGSRPQHRGGPRAWSRTRTRRRCRWRSP